MRKVSADLVLKIFSSRLLGEIISANRAVCRLSFALGFFIPGLGLEMPEGE